MRTKLKVKLLPAGVPRGLVKARYRIAHILSEAPILFLTIVIGVALTFRFGISAVRASETDPDTTVKTPHEPPTRPAVAATATPTPRSADTTASKPTSPITGPTTTPTTLPHRKARAHGRR